jgi:Holliday junction resolvase RusA-like endonuclease
VSDAIKLWIPGIPAPGGSKRFFGRGRVVDDCKRNPKWRRLVAAEARKQYHGVSLAAPLIVLMTFYLPRPKCHFGTGKNAGRLLGGAPALPIVKPDLTKFVRSTEDALTGILWDDDAKIVSQSNAKVYADCRGPGVEVVVQRAFPLQDGGAA